jgi:nitrite reductase/ring-hydroxylating ferredoxin subunit
LNVLAGWLCASPFLASCGSEDANTNPTRAEGSRDAGAGTPDAEAGAACLRSAPDDMGSWVAVAIASLPALSSDGAAILDDDSALIHAWLLDDGGGCYRAVWRICTHGACEVAYASASRDLECPCHGSRFDRDGAVVRGPATKPLRVLEVRRVGDTLYVKKPFG